MALYRPRGDNTGKHNAGIAFPLKVWEEIMKAAADAGIPASAWVRQACLEKLARR